MSKYFLSITLLLLLISGCSEDGNIEDNPGVTPFVQNPEDGAIDIDGFIVFSASIEFYASRLQTCADPTDIQFFGGTANFESKPVVCIRFTVDSRAERNATMITDIVTGTDEFDLTSETTIEEFNGSTITTITRQLQLTPENMGTLPAQLTASIEILNAFDDPIPLVEESLTVAGTVESNEPEFPDGTELIVFKIPPADENSPTPNPGILTRYRDLPLDGNFCVNHDIFTRFEGGLFTEVLQLASGNLLPDRFGQLRAVVEIPRPSEPGTYLARVFPLTVNGICDVNAEPVAPSIIYQVEP